MAEKKIFVGRKDELGQFLKVLESPRGQAILVVGQAGMGKTWLIDKMAEIAEKHPDLKCGWVRYEVTSGDSVDVIMERMIDDAFHAADVVEGSFDATAVRRKQWHALLETIVPKGEKISKLISSFAREEKRPTREQFLERLRLVSAKMKDKGRAIFVIDPLEYLDKEKDAYGEDWAIVVRELPDNIKFVFAQRPEDVLVRYRKFARLSKVSRIPAKKLDRLGEKAVDKLLDLRAGETEYDVGVLRKGLEQYEGHPYALQGALDLLATGTKLEELPDDPTEQGIIEEQWEKICRFGETAIRLFKSYAILEVTVPDDVANIVGKVKRDERLALFNINIYLKNLLHDEGRSKRIYHLLLAKYILGQMSEGEKKEYHGRAVEVYREKLRKAKKEQTKPDALAAMRLPEHVLAAEGEKAFVNAFVNECAQSLINLGLLDAAIGLTARVLEVVEKNSKEEARVLCILGVIYDNRCELNKAEEMYLKALEIDERRGYQKGMSIIYGNLGVTYCRLGELTKAEDVLMAGLKIDEQLGDSLGMASKYSNLGLIYKTRGEFYKAQKMYQNSLEIFEGDQRLEEVGTVLGNIGVIYTRLGDINNAEKMHRKALLIDKRLGRLEGVSRHSSNLGVVYKERGEIEKAENMFRESVTIDEQLCNLTGMATNYGNLGALYEAKGELDKAEEMQKKALAIDEKVGHLEGVARHSSNLGVIYKGRGDIEKARKYWEKALELYKKIGMPQMVEKVKGWIEGLED